MKAGKGLVFNRGLRNCSSCVSGLHGGTCAGASLLCTCERRGARAAAGGAELVERARAVYLGAVDPAYRRCAVLDASVLRCAALQPRQRSVSRLASGTLRKEAFCVAQESSKCRRPGMPATGSQRLAAIAKTGWRASSFLPGARPAPARRAAQVPGRGDRVCAGQPRLHAARGHGRARRVLRRGLAGAGPRRRGRRRQGPEPGKGAGGRPGGRQPGAPCRNKAGCRTGLGMRPAAPGA